MRSEAEIISQLRDWGNKTENVRSIILTSSRVDPNCTLDILSDYDVEVYVKDTTPFLDDESWIYDFGTIIVRWPMRPQVTDSDDWVTQLVIYDDKIRIDFQITMRNQAISPYIDNGFRVIIDKDGITSNFPEPSFSSYSTKCPTSKEFEDRLNAFWWDITYVAKGLCRDELNYAKGMMEGTIRFEKLLPLINWFIGMRNNWKVNTGMFGRKIKQYLDSALWDQYKETFAGADIDSNWRALFSTLEFARTIGREIAKSLGFSYPEQTDRDVTSYINWIYSDPKK